MACNCVERRATGFYVVGSRVPVDRIIWDYHNGEESETIRSHYPTLSLEQIDGVIAFYESHKEEVGKAMDKRRRAEDAYTAANPNPPEIRDKFKRMQQQQTTLGTHDG